MKSFLIYIIISITTICGAFAQQGTVESQINLTSPKPEKNEWHGSKKNTLTILILAEDTAWFCYMDSIAGRGLRYNVQEMDRLLNYVSKRGDSIHFSIKTELNSSPKATVDLLDRLTMLKIKRYTVTRMNDEEKGILAAGGYLDYMAPLEVESPATTSTIVHPSGPTFYMHLRKDGSIWYKNDTSYNKNNFIQWNKSNRDELANRINVFKKQVASENKQGEYIIISHPDSKFDDFNLVIQALEKNDLHKYKLITEENQ